MMSLWLLFVLTGSKRISDSEVSDYDCDDGIGVVSGMNSYMHSSVFHKELSYL